MVGNIFKKISFQLVKRYRHSTLSQWIVLAIDVVLFVVSFVLVEAFRSGGIADFTMRGAAVKFVVSLMVTLIFFFFTRSFRGIIRHTGMNDIYKMFICSIGPLSLFWIVNLVNNQFSPPVLSSAYLLSYRESMMLYLILGSLMIISQALRM